MDVDLRILRHVEVVDVGDAGNIKTTGSDVGRYQDIDGAFLELTDYGVSFLLRKVSVKSFGHIASLLQGFGHFIAAALRADEDDSKLRILHVEQTAERIEFLTVGQFDIFLLDKIDGDSRCFDLHDLRFLQEGFRQLADRCRHGRREEHGLAFFRNSGQNGTDVIDESHIYHFIAFVEHEDLHMRQIDGATLHVVHQTARGRDDDIRVLSERFELALDILSAVDRQCMDRQVLGKMVDLFRRLDGKLTGRREDDGLRSLLGNVDPLQNRNAKSSRLAGTGLCLPDQVLPGKCGRDSGFLDGSRFFKAHILYGFQNFRLHAEFCECVVHSSSLCAHGYAGRSSPF